MSSWVETIGNSLPAREVEKSPPILYSLIYSCKAIGVDPEAYLEDVLQAVATTPSSQAATLTPWAWAERHPEHQVSKPHVDR